MKETEKEKARREGAIEILICLLSPEVADVIPLSERPMLAVGLYDSVQKVLFENPIS